MPPRDRHPNPPTIGDLRGLGMLGAKVTCANVWCRHTADLTFDRIGMPDAVIFIDIPRSRRFVCLKCGERKIEVFPNWKAVRAAGAGRPRY